MERLQQFAETQCLVLDAVVVETASGLDGPHRKLLSLLADESVGTLVVERRERLARCGFEIIESCLHARGLRVLVMEERDTEEYLLREMAAVLTDFCTRLYGANSASERATRALRAASE